jgi:hypothetical protein
MEARTEPADRVVAMKEQLTLFKKMLEQAKQGTGEE